MSHPEGVLDFKTLKSLAPLQGRVSAIHAASFFHLFDEATQSTIAKTFANLLSSEKGSIILGSQACKCISSTPVVRIFVTTYDIARPEKGLQDHSPMFCHSPASWTELWETELFPEGTFKGMLLGLVFALMVTLVKLRPSWMKCIVRTWLILLELGFGGCSGQ